MVAFGRPAFWNLRFEFSNGRPRAAILNRHDVTTYFGTD